MSEILTQGPLFLICVVFMLGVVVVIHELGHYFAGRWFGAAVESFSIGFGEPIYERKDARGTRWRVNWIPFGGFVKFVGESQMAGDVGKIEAGPEGKPYMELGVAQRSVVAVAGPLANFVLAAGLFAAMFLANGQVEQRVSISAVAEGGPADVAGMEVGDVILRIDGKTVSDVNDFQRPIALGTGETRRIVVSRAGEEAAFDVVPIRGPFTNGLGQVVQVGLINVALSVETYGVKRFNPATAALAGVRETVETVDVTLGMLGRMLTGREPLNNLSGPVGIGDLTRRAVNVTLENERIPLGRRLSAMSWTLIHICALVSVGIGLFNLFPLPVLDGGHLVFNAYEALTGKVLPARIQEATLTFGLVLLLSIALVITWGDVVETGIFGGVGA